MSTSSDLIVEQLFQASEKFDLGIRQDNTSLWIRCPWHGGGRENSGSLRISIDDGSSFFGKAKCYACMDSGVIKSYNDVAEHFGLMKLDKNFKAVGFRSLNFGKKVSQRDEFTANFVISTFDWPEGREWRGIPYKTVIGAKGILTEVRHDLDEPRLGFPVRVWRETVGWVYARISDPRRDENGKKIEKTMADKSYLFSSGSWKEHHVYNFDRAMKRLKANPDLPLWICEGVRDCLHLDAAGCAVVATLGSSFSQEKADLIKILNPIRVLVASDNDEAGNKLANSIHEKLNAFFPLTRVRFGEGKDPCDYTRSSLREKNRKYLRGHSKTTKKNKSRRGSGNIKVRAGGTNRLSVKVPRQGKIQRHRH